MNLIDVLEEEGVPYERHTHPAVYTAQELARSEHVPGKNVAKPVLVRAESGFTLCVVPAVASVDLAAVADALCEERIELASEHEMVGIFRDCELGAEPPVGMLFGLNTLVDYSLLDDDFVVFQAGTHTDSIRMSRTDFERITDPMYGSIASLTQAHA